jgi:hypothetical protein
MDPHDAQGSKDISNSNDDPAQGSNNFSTPIHGTVHLHTLVLLSPYQFSKVVIWYAVGDSIPQP